jgi:hypothetical protein
MDKVQPVVRLIVDLMPDGSWRLTSNPSSELWQFTAMGILRKVLTHLEEPAVVSTTAVCDGDAEAKEASDGVPES